ncbi:hypothetical protein [Acetobacter conturbans]|nr:hypothetical protein [Acetobacter conturbans]
MAEARTVSSGSEGVSGALARSPVCRYFLPYALAFHSAHAATRA